MCYVNESETRRYYQLRHGDLQKEVCPYGKESSRKKIKELIAELSRGNHHVRNNIFAALGNIRDEYVYPAGGYPDTE